MFNDKVISRALESLKCPDIPAIFDIIALFKTIVSIFIIPVSKFKYKPIALQLSFLFIFQIKISNAKLSMPLVVIAENAELLQLVRNTFAVVSSVENAGIIAKTKNNSIKRILYNNPIGVIILLFFFLTSIFIFFLRNILLK